jgi:hypothetical protein
MPILLRFVSFLVIFQFFSLSMYAQTDSIGTKVQKLENGVTITTRPEYPSFSPQVNASNSKTSNVHNNSAARLGLGSFLYFGPGWTLFTKTPQSKDPRANTPLYYNFGGFGRINLTFDIKDIFFISLGLAVGGGSTFYQQTVADSTQGSYTQEQTLVFFPEFGFKLLFLPGKPIRPVLSANIGPGIILNTNSSTRPYKIFSSIITLPLFQVSGGAAFKTDKFNYIALEFGCLLFAGLPSATIGFNCIIGRGRENLYYNK